ncbi:MAG: type 4a pilus biogenesis protein PilO [Candidatus Rokubacteria bacterium]|nr:type 4a pilus biogenesis protein PilO [Candidatus Rokubacteria bacterium]
MAFEFITEAPGWQKAVLGILPLAFIGGGGYYFVVSPKLAEVQQLSGEKDALQKKVIQGRTDRKNLAGFEAKAKELEQRVTAARERLPAEKEIPKLYRQISDLATQQGLTVSLFQPKAPQDKDYYAEVPIQLNADAGYHQLGEFFEKLAKLPRIVTLGDFRLVAIERPTGTLQAELTLLTYLARPEGAPKPKPPPGAKK